MDGQVDVMNGWTDGCYEWMDREIDGLPERKDFNSVQVS